MAKKTALEAMRESTELAEKNRTETLILEWVEARMQRVDGGRFQMSTEDIAELAGYIGKNNAGPIA